MKPALLPFALILTLIAGLAAYSQTTSPRTAGAIYAKRCASCHGKNGRAETFKGRMRSARNLADTRWQSDVSDERIFNSITNGRGKMPAYGKKVSEAEINSLVSYVRGLKK